jgi:hypothetical protein
MFLTDCMGIGKISIGISRVVKFHEIYNLSEK